MYKIALINMPFTNLELPSIALTQIQSVVRERLGGQVAIEIHYLSHDFAKYFGMDCYEYLGRSFGALHAGLGDWFFRQAAFPELPDNTEKYLGRYFAVDNAERRQLKLWIAEKRPGLDSFMDELISRYQLDEMNIVGFTSMFMQNAATFAMARQIKRRNPNVIIVMGGANCEYPMGKIIVARMDQIDFAFSGPALKSFPEFAECCMTGDAARRVSIRGVFARGSTTPQLREQRIGEELSIEIPVELDYDPFMSRIEEYFPNQQVHPVLPFETSRGCWWGERAHCTFCGLNGVSMAFRSMKPEMALRVIRSLFRYAGRVGQLTAVDNILPKSYFQQVFPFIDTPENMELFYEIKADLSEEDMAMLAKARVKQVQPGVESLATSTLKLMKKGTTAFQNVTFLKNCALYGIHPYWNLLVGFPGEGEEVYRRYVEVMPRLVHLCPPSGAHPVRFDRFSPYHDQAESYKLDLTPLDFYALVFPFAPEDLNDFAYYFADKNSWAQYVTAIAKWILKLRAVINQWQSRWKQGLPPRLFFKENSNVIYDSRSGKAVEYTVSEAGRAILDHLNRPTCIDDLSKVFGGLADGVLGRELAFLQDRQLVFQEGDRILNIVLEGEHGSAAARSISLPVQAVVTPSLVQIG